eukprot:s494_g4.t1
MLPHWLQQPDQGYSRSTGRSTSTWTTATGATNEKPFAGGLIGGESAFAGQEFNFDPLGLSVKCEKYLPWFREAENEWSCRGLWKLLTLDPR